MFVSDSFKLRTPLQVLQPQVEENEEELKMEEEEEEKDKCQMEV